MKEMTLTRETMVKTILGATPDLQAKRKALAAMETEIAALKGKIEDYTAQAEKLQAEAGRIKTELTKAVAAGQDPAPIQRKARKIREDLADAEALRQATEDVLEDKESALEEARRDLAGLFARAVITAKGEVEATLRKRCAEIEVDLKAWEEAVWGVSREVGCNPPPGRHALSIGGHADLRHALGL